MIDRLRQMAIFAKSVDHGSFRGAARELNLSPSVVSHHISELEAYLGVALMYRSTRKLSLTREGERLLVATQNMLQAVEGELRELSDTAGDPSGELRLTAPSVLSQSVLADQIASFSKIYPRVKLSLDYSDSRRKLVDDGFDIAVRMESDASNSATSRKLFKVQRKLVASKTYLSSRPAVEHPSDLSDWDWLTLMPVHVRTMVFSHGSKGEAKVKPVAHLATNDAQAMYRLSRAGAGLCVVPDFLAEEDVNSGIMEVVLPDWALPSIDVYAEWPANAPKHGLIHMMLDVLSTPQGQSAKAASTESQKSV